MDRSIDAPNARRRWITMAAVGASLALCAACSHDVDAAAPKISHDSDVAPEWRHLIPHTAPFSPARSRDGRLEGPVTMWHENGARAAQGEYRDELRQGLWKFWHENGTPRWEGAFDRGREIGLQREWFENGQLKYECTWVDGELDGKFSAWHDNGRPALQCEFRRGSENGEVRRWNEDGEIDQLVSGVYRDGERVGGLSETTADASAKR